ncbi:glycoside hydrolase family 65 protein [Mangrovibacterium diazotrophicum]|uniref:Trehalose/maltose hydrolase-like predicted phosphorylase n=1 Tax=Mangrovibacterium diazotrophicum TaxID=1261403 RepID=A0A419W5M4_9BACT|nr:glycoside hydrolase family 65 protein [Mangrovibacterium diazotrophicum]RKD90744.1 trehalose/maltose hydrolase-like predicted phosphorylase [Mangrovibacterium diazotrophicum]
MKKNRKFGIALCIAFLALNSMAVFGSTKTKNEETDLWKIKVTDPTDYVGIALSNGRIGMVPSSKPFQVKSIILNNVFDRAGANDVSKILEGINFANLVLVVDGDTINQANIENWEQVLDLKAATLTTRFEVPDKAEVTYQIYALRGMPNVGLIDVDVHALKKDIQISVAGKISCPASYHVTDASFKTLHDAEAPMPLLKTIAKSPFGKHTLATTATFIFGNEAQPLQHKVLSPFEHEINFQRKVKAKENFQFAWTGAVCSTENFGDPQNESERMVIYVMRGNKDLVIKQHKELWADLWQSDIQIEGDPESQRDVRLALYHLYAFSRENSRLSIAPMGLSSQGYNGHIFWDSELWMFPPLLILNQGFAKSMLDYRFDRLGKAEEKAANYGYKGAMFPWESDDTGEEATPTWALTGTFEHHITADVGIACWNYYRLTGNKEWLKTEGFPLLKKGAKFWLSRSSQNSDGSYSINNVVGANEYAMNIDDNAFTNGSVKVALEYATKAAVVCGETPDPKWDEVAQKLRFNYFDDGVTKEHSNYKGEIIKQADVNLLAYPLELVTEKEAVLKDMDYYEPRISKKGPAMGYSIFSVLYARLGDADKAFDLFKRAYVPNKRPPFGALAESATSQNPYFTTGAGGMLQAVLFGFAGLHLADDGLVQKDPCLPSNWKSLTITGVGPEHKTYKVTH